MKCLIYAFLDERGIPFYFGQTRRWEDRKRAHKREIQAGNNLPKYNKIRKVLRAGLLFEDVVVIIEKNIPPEKIDDKETYYIKQYREKGFKLTNLTDGGKGWINVAPETIEKLRKIHLGRKRSKLTKQKISQALKGRKFTNEHKKKLSLARRKRKTTTETRRKTSLTSTGHINIKKYKLTGPDGKKYITTNGLAAFCKQHGLTAPNLMKVLNGTQTHSKGWTIERVC